MRPLIRKVAVPREKHSERFGQRASSQTVCRPPERMRFLISWSSPSCSGASESRPAAPALEHDHQRSWCDDPGVREAGGAHPLRHAVGRLDREWTQAELVQSRRPGSCTVMRCWWSVGNRALRAWSVPLRPSCSSTRPTPGRRTRWRPESLSGDESSESASVAAAEASPSAPWWLLPQRLRRVSPSE